MADNVVVTVNDYGYTITFTIKDKTGTIVDLTGYTIKLNAGIPGATPILTNKTCAIVSAPAGTCSYTVASGDFITPNIYDAELVLTKTGKVLTSRSNKIEVRQEIV